MPSFPPPLGCWNDTQEGIVQSIKHAPLTVAVATLSFGLNAAGDSYIATFSAFMDTSAGETVSILNYMGSEIEQQDARLNLSYKAAIQTLETGPRVQLRDAQHLWTKLRDADCTLLGSLTGGGQRQHQPRVVRSRYDQGTR